MRRLLPGFLKVKFHRNLHSLFQLMGSTIILPQQYLMARIQRYLFINLLNQTDTCILQIKLIKSQMMGQLSQFHLDKIAMVNRPYQLAMVQALIQILQNLVSRPDHQNKLHFPQPNYKIIRHYHLPRHLCRKSKLMKFKTVSRFSQEQLIF